MSAVRQLGEGLGVAGSRALPDTESAAAWEAIVLPDDAKQRLARQAAATLKLPAAGVQFESLPLHGITLLLGPPGRGNTTLARGLANQVAAAARSLGLFMFIEIDPHGLMSSAQWAQPEGRQAAVPRVDRRARHARANDRPARRGGDARRRSRQAVAGVEPDRSPPCSRRGTHERRAPVLAAEAVQIVREYRSRDGRPSRLYLFAAGPNGLLFQHGRNGQPLGQTTACEFHLESPHRGYAPAITLPPLVEYQ